jgi:hypothetical protein
MESRYPRSFRDYVRQLADAMGLSHVHLLLQEDTPDHPDENHDDHEMGGYCYPMDTRHRATLWFPDDVIAGKDLELTREHVVHELLHIHMAPPAEVWRVTLVDTECLSGTVYRALWATYHRQMELSVDLIARHWARLLPLFEVKEGEEG